MTNETVVHVETIEEWKSVLDVWFAQGYKWLLSGNDYCEYYYIGGGRQLGLNVYNDGSINYYSHNNYEGSNLIEYSELIKEQEKTMAKETYYVTQQQLDLIEELKSDSLPFYNLVYSTTDAMKELAQDIPNELDSKILRYIGGDTSIEFKAQQEQLYRLWRIDGSDNMVYMQINGLGTPIWTTRKYEAFKAPLEEIEQWKTPAWIVEKVD